MLNQFHFRNFTPDNDIIEMASKIYNEVQNISPYESTVTAFMKEDEDEGYWGAIDVYCASGPFIARTRASTPQEALKLLKDRISSKVSTWKRTRNLESVDSETFVLVA